jgi:hypothetical protein
MLRPCNYFNNCRGPRCSPKSHVLVHRIPKVHRRASRPHHGNDATETNQEEYNPKTLVNGELLKSGEGRLFSHVRSDSCDGL